MKRISFSALSIKYLRESHDPAESTFHEKLRDFSAFAHYVANGRPVESVSCAELTAGNVRAFMRWALEKNYAPATVNRRLASLRSFSAWIRNNFPEYFDNIREVKPVDAPQLLPRGVTASQQTAIVQAAKETGKRPGVAERNGAMMTLLFGTGLRAFELVSLKLGQLEGDFLLGVVGKGRKIRDVFLEPEVRQSLEHYVTVRRSLLVERFGPLVADSPALPLFVAFGWLAKLSPTFDSMAVSYETIQELTLAAGSAAGVPDFHAHRARHTRAQRMLDKTSDVALVADQLGHSSLQTTMRYLVRNKDEIRKRLSH